MKHLLSIADLEPEEIRSVLYTATSMHEVQRREVKKLPTLRGRTIITFFFEDSTRTRSSFEIAGKWMSADTINLTGKGTSVSKGESLRDTVMTIDAMGVDMMIIRHPASGAPAQIADWKSATQAKYDFTARPHAVAQDGRAYIVTCNVSGAFPGSPVDLRYTFTLARGRIASLEIAA